MSNFTVVLFSIFLLLLIFLSAFFSGAETSLMAINRYRLRHKARMKKRSAIVILKLLKRPDRLLGMILIGNTVATTFSSAIATLLAIYFWGEKGVIFVTVLLTFIILIFAEVAPKTVAALYPERIATLVCLPIFVLLRLFYPLVWFINMVVNGILRIVGVKVSGSSIEPLSQEELRSVVFEATGKVPYQYQTMLLGILDLNKVTVDDVMVPRHAIRGIDLDQSWEAILQQIAVFKYDWMPVYRENINKVVGMLHLPELMRLSLQKKITEEDLYKTLQEPYFIPQGAFLNIQLYNFQQHHKRTALVVDEYGEILGLLTLKNILEEIVGEFTASVSIASKMIRPQSDGSYLVDGAVTIRELNRLTHWSFPIGGPRTLNGLIIEYLESIPRTGTGVFIANHPMEIIEVKDNRVKMARVFPEWTRR